MTRKVTLISDYHHQTSHVRGSITGRNINWSDQPLPFKLYRGIPVFHLPQDLSLPDIPLDQAMNFRETNPETNMPTLLAGVCNLATGITGVTRQDKGTVFHFRSMASAGALYPTELYVALQNVIGMNDGLYHYCPLEHTLNQLRTGQVFSALSGSEPVIRFYLTTIFHRSAWKYGSRAYRYCLLDAGHVAENLLLAARIHGLPARLDYDFNDAAINSFLCLDQTREACLAQVHALGCSPATPVYDTGPPESDNLPDFSRSAVRSSTPPEILTVHQACSAPGCKPTSREVPHDQDTTRLPDPVILASTSSTIQRRRSRRNFVSRPASARDLVDILSLACRDIDAGPPCADAVQIGFLANADSGLTPGYHLLHRGICSTTLVRPGTFMNRAAHICLDQGWLENAAIHLVLSANLEALEKDCGPRAYRYAHLEAGRIGQRTYLAATAKNLGVCGIGAFFDNEATTLLSLPQGHALLYLVAFGPVRK